MLAGGAPGTDSGQMDPAHEARAIGEVQERLEARFPELDPTVVEAAVRLALSEITGPVRDFVPLLVERAARERLQRATALGDAREPRGEETPNVR